MVETNTSLSREQATDEDVKGIVFNIQRYSIHDGPGIRTTVFLKGCPLQCAWCSNPESQNYWPELAHSDTLCVRCGNCIATCKEGALAFSDSHKGVSVDRELCTNCGKCAEVCTSGSLKMFGKEMSAGEVFQAIEKDEEFYRESGGGVTASGGEPLVQPEFVAALFKMCRDAGIRTAIETTGCVKTESLETVLPFTNLVLFDLKHIDPEAHQKWTHVTNSQILQNLKAAAGSQVPVIVRIPLVPGVNDSKEVLEAMAEIVVGTLKQPQVHILPYHRYGTGKYVMLDRSYQLDDLRRPDDAILQRALKIFEARGINCEIVG